MTKIKLYRPVEDFNKDSSYAVLINGKKVAELKNGEEKTIEIGDEPETLNLKAQIHWCGSKKLSCLNLNNDGTIKVTGNKFLNKQLPLLGSIFPLTGMLIFNKNNELFKNVGIAILVLLLLGVIATLTLWKNKWLEITAE